VVRSPAPSSYSDVVFLAEVEPIGDDIDGDTDEDIDYDILIINAEDEPLRLPPI